MELEDDTKKFAQIISGFKVKDTSCYANTGGAQQANKWPRLMVFCASDIPLTHNAYKKSAVIHKDGGTSIAKSVNVNLVIIDGVDEGFTKVPLFKDGNVFKNADGAKPMSKLVDCERLPGSGLKDIQCWPWTLIRENPQAKGPIKEDSSLTWRLQPGMVLRHKIWEDGTKGYPTKEKKPMTKEISISGAEGMEVVPAFTPIIVEIAIKAWCPRVEGEEYVDAVSGQKKTRDAKDLSPVMKQYGIGIGDMKILPGGASMYSCLDKLRIGLMPTHVHALALQKEHIDTNWAIANCLQSTQAPMFVSDLAADTSFGSDPENEIIKLEGWSSGMEEMAIDMTYRDVLRFTNCKTVNEGVALMEFACQAGCLEVVCVHDKYRRRRGDENPIYSELYGIPLINVSKLLACVKSDAPQQTYANDERFFEFDTDYSVMGFTQEGTPDTLYRPKVVVSKDTLKLPSSDEVTTTTGSQDMCLVGSGFCLDRVYLVRFINTLTGGTACSVYLNTSKPSSMNRSSGSNSNSSGASTTNRVIHKRWASGNNNTVTIDPFEMSMNEATKLKKQKLGIPIDDDEVVEKKKEDEVVEEDEEDTLMVVDKDEEDDDDDDDDDDDENNDKKKKKSTPPAPPIKQQQQKRSGRK